LTNGERAVERPFNIADAVGLKPVPVPLEVQGPDLLARSADQIALANQHLIRVPASALAFRAVAPVHDGTATGERAEWKLLEAQDFLDDWARAVQRYDPDAGDGGVPL
jgi:hypothetical protein